MDSPAGALRGRVIVAERRSGERVTGRIELVFRAGREGTTLARSHVTAPLKIVRPFVLADGRALVQVLTLGPGLCGGDACTIDVTAEPGARAVVVMQAASRILGMSDGECAKQSINLAVGAGAQLEYYPGLTIPFADSCLEQRVAVSVHRDARVGILECWAMGRATRDEYLRFRRLSSRTLVSIDGNPVFADAVEIEPGIINAAATGILERHRYLASGFWHGVRSAGPIAPTDSRTLVAFDRGTSDERLFLRALAHDGYAMTKTLQAAIDAVNAAWGLEPIPLRRFML